MDISLKCSCQISFPKVQFSWDWTDHIKPLLDYLWKPFHKEVARSNKEQVFSCRKWNSQFLSSVSKSSLVPRHVLLPSPHVAPLTRVMLAFDQGKHRTFSFSMHWVENKQINNNNKKHLPSQFYLLIVVWCADHIPLLRKEELIVPVAGAVKWLEPLCCGLPLGLTATEENRLAGT